MSSEESSSGSVPSSSASYRSTIRWSGPRGCNLLDLFRLTCRLSCPAWVPRGPAESRMTAVEGDATEGHVADGSKIPTAASLRLPTPVGWCRPDATPGFGAGPVSSYTLAATLLTSRGTNRYRVLIAPPYTPSARPTRHRPLVATPTSHSTPAPAPPIPPPSASFLPTA